MDNCTNTASSVGYTTINYFISRSIMSGFFYIKSEPMDIEGEAECAVGCQGVTAEGEQGPGVEVNASTIEKEADSSCSLTRENLDRTERGFS